MSRYAYLVAGLVALVLLAGTHWRAYTAGRIEVRAEWLEAQTKFQAEARAKEAELSAQLNEARNAAVKRETKLRSDAAGSRQSADRLRNELADIKRKLPDLAADASRQRADTLANVLGECAIEYQSLAERADRIASERQTLIDAWPK